MQKTEIDEIERISKMGPDLNPEWSLIVIEKFIAYVRRLEKVNDSVTELIEQSNRIINFTEKNSFVPTPMYYKLREILEKIKALKEASDENNKMD